MWSWQHLPLIKKKTVCTHLPKYIVSMLDTYWLNLVCICRIVLIKPNATNVIQIYFFVHFKSLSLMLHKNNAHTYLRLELYWHNSLTLVHVCPSSPHGAQRGAVCFGRRMISPSSVSLPDPLEGAKGSAPHHRWRPHTMKVIHSDKRQ